jgi:hypothetical protein
MQHAIRLAYLSKEEPRNDYQILFCKKRKAIHELLQLNFLKVQVCHGDRNRLDFAIVIRKKDTFQKTTDKFKNMPLRDLYFGQENIRTTLSVLRRSR